MTARLRPLLAAAGTLLVVLLSAAPAAAAPGLALPGEPTQASSDPADPTVVEAGISRLTVGPGAGGHRYLRYHRVIAQSTVHISALASVRTDDFESVSLAVTTPGADDDCGLPDTETGYGPGALAISAAVRVGQDVADVGQPADEQDPCVSSRDLDVEIGRGTSESTSDLTVAVRVVEEAPLASVTAASDLLTAVDANTAFQAPRTDGSQAVEGGSLATPAELPDGSAVTGSVRTGSAVVYVVHGVRWGQTVDAQVFTGPVDGVAYAPLAVTLLDPRLVGGRAEEKTDAVTDSERATASAVSGPVRYLNRYGSATPYLPGDYLVLVGVGGQDSPKDVPFTLKVQVRGEEGGVPTYEGDEQPFVVDGTARADLVGTATGGWTLVRGGAVALLALLGLAGVGGGVVLLRRR